MASRKCVSRYRNVPTFSDRQVLSKQCRPRSDCSSDQGLQFLSFRLHLSDVLFKLRVIGCPIFYLFLRWIQSQITWQCSVWEFRNTREVINGVYMQLSWITSGDLWIEKKRLILRFINQINLTHKSRNNYIQSTSLTTCQIFYRQINSCKS